MSLIEVEFKGRRKGIYTNSQEFPLDLHDKIVVKADRGEDLGQISLIGHQWQEKLESNICEDIEIEPVLRKASPEDIEMDKENRLAEKEARITFLELVKKNELVMKLVDCEYQLDKKKLTFYFTADGRVDFRTLVKDLAHHFKTRIDLRQIGARDESKRTGGIGLCGRELCCSSWIREFMPVTTAMVKEQYLLLNPQKNTGLCGRLRCCLRYEVDQYRSVNNKLPRFESKVQGPRGDGVVEKLVMCNSTCGILWEDGTRHLYTLDDLIKYADWDPDLEEKPMTFRFKKDPSQKEQAPVVASAPAPETGEQRPRPVSNGKHEQKQRKPQKTQRPAPIQTFELEPATKPSESRPPVDNLQQRDRTPKPDQRVNNIQERQNKAPQQKQQKTWNDQQFHKQPPAPPDYQSPPFMTPNRGVRRGGPPVRAQLGLDDNNQQRPPYRPVADKNEIQNNQPGKMQGKDNMPSPPGMNNQAPDSGDDAEKPNQNKSQGHGRRQQPGPKGPFRQGGQRKRKR